MTENIVYGIALSIGELFLRQDKLKVNQTEGNHRIIVKMLEKGQVLISKEVRKKVDISPGDKVEIRATKEGAAISPLKKSFTESFKGCVKGKLSLDELDKLYAEKS